MEKLNKTQHGINAVLMLIITFTAADNVCNDPTLFINIIFAIVGIVASIIGSISAIIFFLREDD